MFIVNPAFRTRPIKPDRLQDHIKVERFIFCQGDALFSEHDINKKTGVDKKAIRCSLYRLEYLGVIREVGRTREKRKGRPARVFKRA